MSKMSHINVIEKYEEHHNAIHNMLSSILSCLANEKIFEKNQQDLTETIDTLCGYYPFISLLYLLGADGKQLCMNIPGMHYKDQPKTGSGTDRSKRPYYLLALGSDAAVVTEPYLSSIKRELCLSVSLKICNTAGEVIGIIVLDIDYLFPFYIAPEVYLL